ncbi:type II secretion system major pseudopilin GspG [Candidatus Auribacterota bacterium]
MKIREKTGFTLIELMLVVIILGVLVSIVAPRLKGKTKKAKVAATKTTIDGNLALALDLYELDNGDYPVTNQGLEGLRKKPANASSWKGPYLKKRVPLDPWGNAYNYVCPGVHNQDDYDLSSNGPDGVVGGGDDIVNWDNEEQA